MFDEDTTPFFHPRFPAPTRTTTTFTTTSSASTHARLSSRHKDSETESIAIHTVSIGLSAAGFQSSFPHGYLTDTLAPCMISSTLVTEFIRVILTTYPSRHNARQEWAQHAQTVIFQHLSMKRFMEKEDKLEAVRNIRHFGFIVYESIVEVFEMCWQHGCQMDKNSKFFFPSCQVYALGILDVSRAEDVAILGEFITVVTRWGLAKCCMAYADNLHRGCWQRGRHYLDPSRMTSFDTTQYWSSQFAKLTVSSARFLGYVSFTDLEYRTYRQFCGEG